MNSTGCANTKDSLSTFLDGTMSGTEMQAVAAHMESCANCAAALEEARALQQVLAALGPVEPPADLGLKLRLAISHENARRQGRWWDAVTARWDNIWRPALVQYSAGLASALVLVGGITLTIGMVAAPEAVLAHDEPLGALTVPHYLYSAAPAQAIITPEETTILVQADIGTTGEVYNYAVLSGPQDAQVEAQVRNQLMLLRYEPARAFGEPIRGRVLITFAGANVRS